MAQPGVSLARTKSLASEVPFGRTKSGVSMARTKSCASNAGFGRTKTGVSMARTKTYTSAAPFGRTATSASMGRTMTGVSMGRTLTGASIATVEDEVDFFVDASIDTVRDIVLDPPEADMYESPQPDMVLLDSSYGSVKAKASTVRRSGAVLLNVYDLNENFRKANEILGVGVGGAFHVGVEVFGTEWFYGQCGVTSTLPRVAGHHVYNSSVFLGITKLDEIGFADELYNLCQEWQGAEYQLISHNCCSFATVLCERMGVTTVPSWISRVPYLLDTGRRVSHRVSVDAMDTIRAVQDNMALITNAIVQKTKPAPKALNRAGSPDFKGPRARKDLMPKHLGDKANECDIDPIPEDDGNAKPSATHARLRAPVLLGRGQSHVGNQGSKPSVTALSRKCSITLGSQPLGSGSLIAAPQVLRREMTGPDADGFGKHMKSTARSPSPLTLQRTFATPSPSVASPGTEANTNKFSAAPFKFVARSASPPPVRMSSGGEHYARSRQPPFRQTSGYASPPSPTAPNMWSWPFAAVQSPRHRSPSPLRRPLGRCPPSTPAVLSPQSPVIDHSNHFSWAWAEHP